jgi:hypothetical protein
MAVFEDPPGFSANVTSLVRLRSGTYLYGGAMATMLEPDQGPVDTTNIAAPQRKIVWAQPPSPSARIVTRLGATERAYSFSTCVPPGGCQDAGTPPSDASTD